MGLFDRLKDTFGSEWGDARRYECLDCGEAFAYPSTLEDPACPYCDSQELVGVELA
jgi:DNA-directed RNA polymerase subunit RPC12/RpoP